MAYIRALLLVQTVRSEVLTIKKIHREVTLNICPVQYFIAWYLLSIEIYSHERLFVINNLTASDKYKIHTVSIYLFSVFIEIY